MFNGTLALTPGGFLAVVLFAPVVMGQPEERGRETTPQEVETEALALDPAHGQGPSSVDPAPAVAPAPTSATPPSSLAAPTRITERTQVRLQDLPKHRRYRGETNIDGYVLEERWRPALVIPGLAMVGAAYFTGLAIGSFDDYDNQKGFLAIPVVGPWLTLASREDDCDDSPCPADRLLIVSGAMQTIGLGMVIVGTTWTKRLWVREDVIINWAPQRFANGGYGATLYGTF